MDLGFGGSNQEVGSAAANVLLQNAVAQERAMESEMRAYDSLLQDDDALNALRSRRIQEMQDRQNKMRKWKSLGHGVYTELGGGSVQVSVDIAKAFFEASKESDRLVVHFYRPTTRLCDVMHAHLEKLAASHLETKFAKINVSTAEEGGGAAYLVEKLGIVILPTVLIVRNRQAVHHIRGFDELGATPDFSTGVLARLLGQHDGVQVTEQEENEEDEEGLEPRGINAVRITKNKSGTGASSGFFNNQEDDDD
jgi:thioredoxin-like negative regulator of GroEL